MSTANKSRMGLQNPQRRNKLFNFKNTRQGGLIGVFLIFTFLIVVTSCNKEDLKSDTQSIFIKQNIIYKGVKYPMEGTYDTITKQVNYTSKPEALLAFGQDTNIATVTHAIIYEDRTDIYLYDDTLSFNQNVQFGDGNQNRLKSMNGARCKTYDGLGYSGLFAIPFGTNYRNFTNPNWHNSLFGSVWGYQNGWSWVGSWENDAISSLTLEDLNPNWSTERVHFMGCQHAVWGGSRLYITLASTSTHKLGVAPVAAYPFKLWGWLPWGTWDNKISSYEIVQANVWVGGHTI